MTVRALVGLLALNGAFLLVGIAILWGLRGFRSWDEPVRLGGVAYLLGVASFGTLWTTLLVLGLPFGGAAIVVSLVAVAATGVIGARLAGRGLPRGWRSGRAGPVLLVSAAGLALTGLLLESWFRAARLQSLQAYDAWAFWVPKAKAIFFYGELDEQVFTTAPGPSYPPLVPILDAAAFHAMGGADTITFHVQFWFLVVGGVAAIVGCLHARVPAWLLWPPILLVLVVPRFQENLLAPQADVLVDLLFVAAALLTGLWLREGGSWRIASAALLLAGAALTKREGLVFACAVLVVAFAVGRARRGAWWQLAGAAAFVAVAVLPWRLWYGSRAISADAPAVDGGGADRLRKALELSLEVLFDNGLWSVAPIVALIALLAGAVWGDRRLTAFFGVVLGLAFLGGEWVTYGYTELPLIADEAVNPIVRYTGALVLLGGASTPLLLSTVWRDVSECER